MTSSESRSVIQLRRCVETKQTNTNPNVVGNTSCSQLNFQLQPDYIETMQLRPWCGATPVANMFLHKLSPWWCGLSAAGDWLQGPYVYALYEFYGFDRGDIGRLFIAGFGSSMVFGTIVGSLADKTWVPFPVLSLLATMIFKDPVCTCVSMS